MRLASIVPKQSLSRIILRAGDGVSVQGRETTYRSAGDLVMAALAGHLEGNIVRGVALDLEGAGRQVVEILVQELERHFCEFPIHRGANSSSGEACAKLFKGPEIVENVRHWPTWQYRRRREQT